MKEVQDPVVDPAPSGSKLVDPTSEEGSFRTPKLVALLGESLNPRDAFRIAPPIDPSKLDSNYYCFHRFDANDKVDDTLMYQLDSLGKAVVGVIRKAYPYAHPDDSLLLDSALQVVRRHPPVAT